MLMLMLSRHWHEIQRNVQSGVINLPLGDELAGKVLLIIGFGAAGKELARRAAPFGMRIHAIDVREISAGREAPIRSRVLPRIPSRLDAGAGCR